jgi:lipopolysaccharide/colanic/teichoic acid biosynthesis glycosyltransferase
MRLYQQFGKRATDICLSATALVLLAPLLVAVALLVRCRLGAPVLYWQQRPGLNGRAFWMPKFRTMTEAHDASGSLLPDGERLTRLGRWLRAASLDELPELWVVLRGDMSVVGPRPLLMDYLALYTPDEHRRHAVKPGITGLAQVNGRNAISWEEKFAYDLQYVEELSLWLDLKILVKSFVQVLRRRGISAAGHSTMPFFTGTENNRHEGPSRAA